MSSNARDRILDAAWALVQQRGDANLAMGQVARSAGVSRQAVYLHFEHRAGLLTAMARRHDEDSGFRAAIEAAVAREPADEALAEALRCWFAYIPQILSVARALEAAALTGDEGAAAWQDRMRDLRAAFRTVVRRLDAEGRLAGGLTIGEATDWIYARAHLSAYDQLVHERGWPPERFAQRTIASVRQDVVAR